jgi:LytS/YehU family sensor histidine kinase
MRIKQMNTKELTFALMMGALGSALFAISYYAGQIAPGIAFDFSLIAALIAGFFGGPITGFTAGLIVGVLPGIMFGPLGMGGIAGLIGLPIGKGLSGLSAGLVSRVLELGKKKRSPLWGIPSTYLSYVPESIFTYAYFVFLLGIKTGGTVFLTSILPKALVEVTLIGIIMVALMRNTGFSNFVRIHFTKSKANDKS